MQKQKWMLGAYYAPGIIGLLRILLTIYYFIKNPLGMPLRYFQLIPCIAIGVALFSYYKLFTDGVPIITVIAPTMVHQVLIYIFSKRFVILPFIPIVLLDIIFLSVKGLKASMFPFDIDGDEDDMDRLFSDLE